MPETNEKIEPTAQELLEYEKREALKNRLQQVLGMGGYIYVGSIISPHDSVTIFLEKTKLQDPYHVNIHVDYQTGLIFLSFNGQETESDARKIFEANHEFILAAVPREPGSDQYLLECSGETAKEGLAVATPHPERTPELREVMERVWQRIISSLSFS